MKTLLILLLTAIVSFGGEFYHVSKGAQDKEKLNSVYNAVADLDYKAQYLNLPHDGRLMAKVKQVIDDSNYVVSGNSRYMRGPTANFWLKFGSPLKLTKGETVAVLVKRSGESKIHTFTTGATRTLPVLEEQHAGQHPERMTEQQFVAKLKSGAVYHVPNFAVKSCGNCLGDGKLGATSNYSQCLECEGTGEKALQLVVKW